jgi:DNA invertase Pin-like site-specific DNA recombinase
VSNYAYLRVSTDRQDVDNQKHGILEYCNDRHLAGLAYVRDGASGKVKWRDRQIGKLLTEVCQPGDTVVFAEISRMARSTLQVLEILEYCAQHQINVHIAKQRMVLDDSMQSRITATVLGLAAEIEREFISLRTKEALAKRKQEGHTLGRPKGKAEKVKLDAHEAEILGYLEKQVSKRAIAKILGCAPSTLYEWIERRGLNKYKKARGRANSR